ncbi:phage tail tape measure protein [Paracoccus sp. PAR01]|uniref:phage tail tape measure protein n=1 Tax=Paracoccus sp. PAR01 TaxID=2769282 RepID=UPI001783EBAD|nr:phage tail tape measure protein [Paracoccus sp. PAR01]MBD9525205.1 phage tail tape measure protein [Paracoccus sp. PAR01]
MATSVVGKLRVIMDLDAASLRSGMKQASASLARMGDTMKSMGQSMSLALTAPLTGFAALSLRAAGNFEASMNRVQAATGASQAEFAALRKAALDMGKTTQFSASESADAIEVLAKNGVSAADILGGALQASMLLAASAGTDLASAGDVATDVMLQFGKQASDLTSLVDGMNGVMLASKFGFEDYRLALAQAGGVAGGLGVSFEDFNASIAATSSLFASGSDAGTSFKTFLTRLVPASDPAAAAIKELGLEFFDANGKMKSMAEISQELQDGLKGLSDEARNDALSTIFGNDALRTAIGLAEQGADGIDKLKASIGKTSSEEQAAARMKGLNGALKEFSSAIEALQIAIADSGLLKFVEELVRGMTQLVAKLSEANPELLKWGVIIGAAAAALGPLLLGFGALAAGLPVVLGGLTAAVVAIGAVGAPVAAAVAAIAAAAATIIFHWETVGPWFTTLFTSIGDMFMGLAKTLAGIVTGDMTLAVDSLKQAWSGLDTFFRTLWDGVVAVFNEAWAKIQPIVDKIKSAAEMAQDIHDRALGSRDGPISSGAYTGGATGPILPGTTSTEMINGVAVGTGAAGAQGASDAASYEQGWRDQMQIKSPSKVMMEIGQYLTQGLGAGIANEQPYLQRVTADAGETFEHTMMRHFSGVIKGTTSVKEAFANMIQDMAAQAASSSLSNLFGVLGNVLFPDPLTSALAAAGAPVIPGFASGVRNFKGGWARINELGGEIVKLPKGSDVIPHDISTRMADNVAKGQSLQMQASELTLTDDGKIMATVQASFTQYDRNLPQRMRRIDADNQQRHG